MTLIKNLHQLFVFLLILHNPEASAKDFHMDTLRFYSHILSEERTLLIIYPNHLDTNDSVSLVYMLDGELVHSRLNAKKMTDKNQCIWVGIMNTNRRRDLLPVNEANKFQLCIDNEIIPFVESEFCVSERILFGHSFAGAFTLYSMLNHPGLFDRYIVSSPTPIMNLVDIEQYHALDIQLSKPIGFYLSYGSKDMRQVRKWSLRLVEKLNKTTFNNIHFDNEIFEGENHHTSVAQAIQRVII